MTSPLTGAEKSRLRGRGQLLEAALKIGREGATPAAVRELDALLTSRQLVKVRFLAHDRKERAALHDALAKGTGSVCIGSVGATALFNRSA